ncbi:unnamed protein product, partial [Ixodes pacificus]
ITTGQCRIAASKREKGRLMGALRSSSSGGASGAECFAVQPLHTGRPHLPAGQTHESQSSARGRQEHQRAAALQPDGRSSGPAVCKRFLGT